MSLLAAKTGTEVQQTAKSKNKNDFFIGFPLDAELLLGVGMGAGVVEK
jgi:hypothetical protein